MFCYLCCPSGGHSFTCPHMAWAGEDSVCPEWVEACFCLFLSDFWQTSPGSSWPHGSHYCTDGQKGLKGDGPRLTVSLHLWVSFTFQSQSGTSFSAPAPVIRHYTLHSQYSTEWWPSPHLPFSTSNQQSSVATTQVSSVSTSIIFQPEFLALQRNSSRTQLSGALSVKVRAGPLWLRDPHTQPRPAEFTHRLKRVVFFHIYTSITS